MDYKPEFLYLTTIGRQSGEPRQIEIWYVAYADCFYLCAEHREQTQWVRNIQQHSGVTFWVLGQMYQGQGRVLDRTVEPELTATVTRRFDEKYQWSDGLLVELCPLSA
ncbi:MAG TPA: nitroreductase/quinone reductase family protein [Phototrophicaceae bacterium]|nr:nitroreductase/quinone reductase family protein [Phototrophicaceae bacterium]